MVVKLIQPKMTRRPMDSAYKSAMAPSLALLTLAALTPEGHDVYIEDENVESVRLNDFPDVVGVTVNLDTSVRAYEIAASYRKRNIPVLAGGIHASADPDEVLRHFNAVCVGEAECVWETMLNDAQNGTLQKIYHAPADMDKTPVPLWEKIIPRRYLYTNTVCTGRGCPYSCEFCYNSCEYVLHATRNRPYENVLEEIKRLDTRHIMFIDDNFIGDIDWTRGFLKSIKHLRPVWNAAVSADLVNHPYLLDLMKESGCKSLFIGFESINDLSIKSVKKRQNRRASYEKLIQEIHARGIMVNASIVFGFDEDRPDVFENTLEWLVENKVETMTAHILTPYPGTVLYKRLLSESRIIDFDHTHYNTSYAVFLPKHMTKGELEAGYLRIYREFYSFRNIFRRLPDCREQRAAYLLFNLVYRKFGRFTSLIAKMGLMHAVGRWARKLSYDI